MATKIKIKCTGDPDTNYPGKYVFGIDEAGRGPIAGPMFVGIVGFMPFFLAECQDQIKEIGLKDSKQLSEAKRFEIEKSIIAQTNSIVVEIPAKEIDKAININDLFDRHVSDNFYDFIWSLFGNKNIDKFIRERCMVLVDGNRKINGIPFVSQYCRSKLDASSWSVAAASIRAKNAQVKYMQQLHKYRPEYNFGKHKGYGTKEHFETIKKYGFNEEHRMSWIDKGKLE
jgi:ribonuclease HII